MESVERDRAVAELREGRPRFDLVSIDVLRAFAALWVVSHHANLMFWQSPLRDTHPDAIVRWCYHLFGLGWLGVPLFFVISGFCIHLPYARQARLNPREYIVRRAVRIWPPYAAAIVAGLIFVLAKGGFAPSLFAHFAANLAFIFPGRGPIGEDNIVFWSIVVEVQLYAIYLLIRMLPGRLIHWTIAFVLFGITYHLAIQYWPLPGGAIERIAKPRFFAPARMGEWLLGAMLAERLVNRPPTADRRVVDGLLIVAGTALIAESRALTVAMAWEQHTLETFASAGFAMIVAGLVRAERRRPVPRPWRIAAFLGHRSYSLYLFHFLAINVVLYVATRFVLPNDGQPVAGTGPWLIAIAGGVLLGFFMTEVSYRFVEKPSHQLARRWGRSIAAPSPQ